MLGTHSPTFPPSPRGLQVMDILRSRAQRSTTTWRIFHFRRRIKTHVLAAARLVSGRSDHRVSCQACRCQHALQRDVSNPELFLQDERQICAQWQPGSSRGYKKHLSHCRPFHLSDWLWVASGGLAVASKGGHSTVSKPCFAGQPSSCIPISVRLTNPSTEKASNRQG